MSTSSGTFDVDETITQATTGVGRVVEWDSSEPTVLSARKIWFLWYKLNHCEFGFSGTQTITGGTSGATGTPSNTTETVTLANSDTLTLTTGYANPELQSSGNIVYLENRKLFKGQVFKQKI